MRVSRRKSKTSQLAVRPKPVRREIDLHAADPNTLRDAVREALTALEPEEMEVVRHELVSQLKDTGINVGGTLFLLGIPVRTEEDLTPLDLGQLVRYAKLNLRNATNMLAGSLYRILNYQEQPSKQPSKRAA